MDSPWIPMDHTIHQHLIDFYESYESFSFLWLTSTRDFRYKPNIQISDIHTYTGCLSHDLCNIWDTPFLGLMLAHHAALWRAEQAILLVLFVEKKLEIFYFVYVRARYEFSLVFGLSPVCRKLKFKFSVDIQLFGQKTTSHGKSDLKN